MRRQAEEIEGRSGDRRSDGKKKRDRMQMREGDWKRRGDRKY